jgi:hypothetical protein
MPAFVSPDSLNDFREHGIRIPQVKQRFAHAEIVLEKIIPESRPAENRGIKIDEENLDRKKLGET